MILTNTLDPSIFSAQNLVLSKSIITLETENIPTMMYWSPSIEHHIYDKPDYVPSNIDEYNVHVKELYIQIAQTYRFISDAIYFFLYLQKEDSSLCWEFRYASSQNELLRKLIIYDKNITPEEFGILMTIDVL